MTHAAGIAHAATHAAIPHSAAHASTHAPAHSATATARCGQRSLTGREHKRRDAAKDPSRKLFHGGLLLLKHDR
jgi:hypothetical protein